MKYLLFLLTFFHASFVFSESFEGEWISTDIVHRGSSWSISEKEAKLFVGKKIKILKDSATSEGVTCKNPEYTIESLKSADFYSWYRVSLADIGVSDQVVNVREIRCSNVWHKFGYIFIYTSNKQLFVMYDGYFFKMKRT